MPKLTKQKFITTAVFLTAFGVSCKKKKRGVQIANKPKPINGESTASYDFNLRVPMSFTDSPTGLTFEKLSCDSTVTLGYGYITNASGNSAVAVVDGSVSKESPQFSCTSLTIKDSSGNEYKSTFSESQTVSSSGENIRFSNITMTKTRSTDIEEKTKADVALDPILKTKKD